MLDNQKMLAEQRRGVILEELGRAGSVSVADLSRRLKVSDMTIRRDLEELSGRKLLRKVHGGAVPLPKSNPIVRDPTASDKHPSGPLAA